jgi:hypothetical protein
MTAARDAVAVFRADTRVVSDRLGDLDHRSSPSHGLVHDGTRHLSHWRLTVDGRSPRLLVAAQLDASSAVFYLVPDDEDPERPACSIVRWRTVDERGLRDDLVVTNHADVPLTLELAVDAGSGVGRTAWRRTGAPYRVVERGRLVLGQVGDAFVRETWVTSSSPDAVLTEDGLRLVARVPARGEWRTSLEVAPAVRRPRRAPRAGILAARSLRAA